MTLPGSGNGKAPRKQGAGAAAPAAVSPPSAPSAASSPSPASTKASTKRRNPKGGKQPTSFLSRQLQAHKAQKRSTAAANRMKSGVSSASALETQKPGTRHAHNSPLSQAVGLASSAAASTTSSPYQLVEVSPLGSTRSVTTSARSARTASSSSSARTGTTLSTVPSESSSSAAPTASHHYHQSSRVRSSPGSGSSVGSRAIRGSTSALPGSRGALKSARFGGARRGSSGTGGGGRGVKSTPAPPHRLDHVEQGQPGLDFFDHDDEYASLPGPGAGDDDEDEDDPINQQLSSNRSGGSQASNSTGWSSGRRGSTDAGMPSGLSASQAVSFRLQERSRNLQDIHDGSLSAGHRSAVSSPGKSLTPPPPPGRSPRKLQPRLGISPMSHSSGRSLLFAGSPRRSPLRQPSSHGGAALPSLQLSPEFNGLSAAIGPAASPLHGSSASGSDAGGQMFRGISPNQLQFATSDLEFVESTIARTGVNSQLRWRIGREIGRGSFGKVYQGMVDTGEMVAIKEIDLKHCASESARQRAIKSALREVELLTKLRAHPNVVTLLGASQNESGDTISLILEHVAGKSIAQRLTDFGPMPEPLVRNMAGQCLHALAFLHRSNIVHRDVKGANILVSSSGVVKLADFGGSKELLEQLSHVQGSETMSWTAAWVAPEALNSGYDHKVDIWSLGCTVIEMITGKPPWSEMNFENPMQILYHVGSKDVVPAIPENLSKTGKDFLRRCLQRDPKKRPSAEELLGHGFVCNDLSMNQPGCIPHVMRDRSFNCRRVSQQPNLLRSVSVGNVGSGVASFWSGVPRLSSTNRRFESGNGSSVKPLSAEQFQQSSSTVSTNWEEWMESIQYELPVFGSGGGGGGAGEGTTPAAAAVAVSSPKIPSNVRSLFKQTDLDPAKRSGSNNKISIGNLGSSQPKASQPGLSKDVLTAPIVRLSSLSANSAT